MRLIDADELRRWLNGYIETDNISPTYIRALIDSQQTVEAIPIKRIKETIKLAENVQASKYAEHLRILLEDWEEENGRSK